MNSSPHQLTTPNSHTPQTPHELNAYKTANDALVAARSDSARACAALESASHALVNAEHTSINPPADI